MLKTVTFSALCATIIGGSFISQVAATEVTYRDDIKPLWEQHCSNCHGKSAPTLGRFKEDSDRYKALNRGPRMMGYAELTSYVVWPETGALMRRLDDGSVSGNQGNMYEELGDNEAERQANLQLFKDWVGGENAWYFNRWNARGDVPGVTKEQINELKLLY